MNYLKQALMELLSGLTTKKNEKEIWVKVNNKWDITVEPIDDEHYIVRSYWDNGQLGWENQYKNDQLHGFCREWHDNGQIWLEEQYKNNKRHGVVKIWNDDGILSLEEIWKNGKLIEEIK